MNVCVCVGLSRAMESDARKTEQKLRASIRELETRNVQIQRRDKQYIVCPFPFCLHAFGWHLT